MLTYPKALFGKKKKKMKYVSLFAMNKNCSVQCSSKIASNDLLNSFSVLLLLLNVVCFIHEGTQFFF